MLSWTDGILKYVIKSTISDVKFKVKLGGNTSYQEKCFHFFDGFIKRKESALLKNK